MQIISSRERHVYPVIFPTSYGAIGTINFFIINDGGSLTLIDTGIDHEECWNYFNLVLAEQGCKVTDIDRIILTHHHEDHVGLLKRILAIKNIPIYAHPLAILRLQMDVDFFRMRYQFFNDLYKEMDCFHDAQPRLERLTRTLNELDDKRLIANYIPIQEGDNVNSLEVFETPGHSPDSISLYDQERKWLFTGDLVLNESSTNAIVDPDQNGVRLKSVTEQRKSLAKCAEIDVWLTFPGHQTIIENHKPLIHQKIGFMNRKCERILTLLTEKPQTASSLAKQYYRSKYRTEFSLVMSEIIGYLDYLEEHQLVEKKKVDGVWIYSQSLEKNEEAIQED
ncbi:MBL fold metallo-hydrolase [Rummeliibacillus pycnus]|uniref:MBL fold metallo-hydrolase n=1 Tax=Rummeliibacillus pycnus TaxID=101070 RepID=UPI000C9D25E3|nr:MBL fold metallo-hydrolase [Rummeliibacillus pycnus]